MESKELLAKAHQAYRVRDYESAESILSRYLESSPEDSGALLLLGSTRAADGRFEDAAAAFRKAISLDAENVEAFNNLGVTLRQSGQNDAAVRAFNQALSLDRDRGDIHYNLGNLYKVIGDQGKATEHYRAAIASDPRVSMAYNNLGNLLLGQGDVGGAIEVFRDGLQVDPNHPSLHYNLGVAYQFQEMPEQAISSYEQALKSRPGWPAALNNLGVLYQKTNHLQEAKRAFLEAVKTEPDDATALNNLGTVKALLGDVDAAVADFQRSLRVTPEYERPAENLAQLLQAHPEVENAPKILESLATRYQRNQIVQQARAENALGRGDYPTAEAALEVLVDRDSSDRYALRMLGVLAFRRGDTERAQEFFRRLEALHPPDRSYRKDVARVQLEEGKHEAALKTIDGYLRQEPEDLDGLVCRGDILMEQGRNPEALDFLKGLADQFPDSTRVLSRIAQVHRRMGDREEALDAADRLISLQGQRGNAEDLTSLNESLRMYEEAVEAFEDEYSEVWHRNLERLAELVETASEVPAEEAAEALTPDESPKIDEDSIPILDLSPMEFQIEDELEIEAEDLEDDMMWEGEDEPDSILRQAESLGGGYGGGPGTGLGPATGGEPGPGAAPAPATGPPPGPPATAPVPATPAPEPPSPGTGSGTEEEAPPPGPPTAPPGPGTGSGTEAETGNQGGTGNETGADTEAGGENQAGTGGQSPAGQTPVPPPATPPSMTSPPQAPQPALTGSISIVSGPPWPAQSVPPTGRPGGGRRPGGPQQPEAPAPATGPPPGDVISGVYPPPVSWSQDAEEEESVDEEILDEIEEDEAPEHGDEPEVPVEPEEPEVALEEELELPEDFGSVPDDEGIIPEESPVEAPLSSAVPLGAAPSAPRGDGRDNISKAALFDYLLDLSQALPKDRQKAFADSDLPLKIATIRSRLLGSSGLRNQIQRAGFGSAAASVGSSAGSARVTPTRIADTFSYLSQISGFLPKSTIGSALQQRIQRISDKLSQLRENT